MCVISPYPPIGWEELERCKVFRGLCSWVIWLSQVRQVVLVQQPCHVSLPSCLSSVRRPSTSLQPAGNALCPCSLTGDARTTSLRIPFLYRLGCRLSE